MLARIRPGIDDALRLAAELVDEGFAVALEPEGNAAEFAARVVDAGLRPHCELTVPVDRLGSAGALADLSIALSGARDAVTKAAALLPGARVVVPAAEPGAESWCRALAGRRVRLTAGSPPTELAFVRCLNVLMAGEGHPAVATADPRLVALSVERAAWNDRTPDSWEHVMPLRARTSAARRLLAAGHRVRVVVGAPR